MREMGENTFEIRDAGIDVEEIMAEIRENIRRRKESGLYPADQVSPGVPDGAVGGGSRSAIDRDLVYLSDNWNIKDFDYFISSHRPVTGKFLVKGRELVHGEVRRYVDPAFWRQSEFNGSAVRVFNDMQSRLADLEDRLHPEGAFVRTVRDDVTGQILGVLTSIRTDVRGEVGRKDGISSVQSQTGVEVGDIVAGLKSDFRAILQDSLRQEHEAIRSEISSVNDAVAKAEIKVESLVEEKVWERLAEMDAEIRDRIDLARVLERRVSHASLNDAGVSGASDCPDETGLNYFVFEERFRGSRKEIMGRQETFLPYFEGCQNVLDIGCGRGEFLELVRERGIGARGVDIDATMVDFCRSKKLDVEKMDAVPYLETLVDRSLDGIFIDQVVEHLEPACLVRLLELCHRKLQYGYYLIVGTVNPLSFVSLANFYIDMNHVRPVHPETLQFLFGAAGFREVETQFSSQVPEAWRLHRFPEPDWANDENKAFFESYNHTIDRLNGILYGAQDYAVIGKK